MGNNRIRRLGRYNNARKNYAHAGIPSFSDHRTRTTANSFGEQRASHLPDNPCRQHARTDGGGIGEQYAPIKPDAFDR